MASSSRSILREMSAISRVSPSRLFSTTPSLGPRSTTKPPPIDGVVPPPFKGPEQIEVLSPTQYRPRPYGHHVATLTFKGFSSIPAVKENLVFFSDFAARAAYAFGIPVSGPSPAKKRKELWTVIKGPFVHKKAQENFERITSTRNMRVYDANEEVIEKWLHYLRIHSMIGVKMRAEIFRRRPVGIGALTFEAAKQTVQQSQQKVESKALPQGGAPSQNKEPYQDSPAFKEALAMAHFMPASGEQEPLAEQEQPQEEDPIAEAVAEVEAQPEQQQSSEAAAETPSPAAAAESTSPAAEPEPSPTAEETSSTSSENKS